MPFKKFITLFAIIGLPPLIYIVYVTFAQNHYVSLNFYGEKQLTEEINPETNLPDTIYYQLDLAEVEDVGSTPVNSILNDKFTVVSFYRGSDKDDKRRMVDNFERIQNSFSGNEFVQQLVFVEEGADNKVITDLLGDKFFCVELEKEEIHKISEKVFFESECSNMNEICKTICIVDYERHIRGYFNGVMNKEVDDMMGALRVLKIEFYNENPI